MRKSKLFSFLILISSAALILVGSPPASSQTAGPERGSMILSYSFDEPLLREIDMRGTAYTSICIPGSLTIARNAGEPALPVRFVKILLPPGKDVSRVDVTGRLKKVAPDGIDLKASPIFPYQDPQPFGTAQPPDLTIDNQLYSSEELFPAGHFADPRVGFCRGYTILSVALFPVKYVPGAGELFYFSEMTVTVDLEDKSGAPGTRDGSRASWAIPRLRRPTRRSRRREATTPAGSAIPQIIMTS